MLTSTLVLNKDATPLSLLPLSLISWENAIRLSFQGKVHVLHEYEKWAVHSPTTTMRVPSVVITHDYVKWNRMVKYNRSNIFLRDDYICQLCMKLKDLKDLTLDHVVPKSKGGKSTWTNIVSSCKRCNEAKGDNEKIVPKRMPRKPNYYEMIAKRKLFPLKIYDESWLNYIDWPEDKIELIVPFYNK